MMGNAIDITKESKNELVNIVWNNDSLRALIRNISFLRKSLDKRYIYSEVQWKELYSDLMIYLDREAI